MTTTRKLIQATFLTEKYLVKLRTTFPGAVLADITYSLQRGKPHHGKKGHPTNHHKHQDQGSDSDEYPSSLEEHWDVSEEDKSLDTSQNPGYPWPGHLPTFRLIHRGRLLPPLIEHTIPKNLSEDESLEPVTICGPGWHPAVGGHPPMQPPDSVQRAPMSFSGVQFFFGNMPPFKNPAPYSIQPRDIDAHPNDQPSDNNDAPFIVS
ncbi:uncharacterized protein LOC142765990 [Rhipicephalus microplus]|uniref:uncharacterized protein LOC142765990 n=1 Tax=Rhipicephalus microplus TaxID=6941 RepID=UPI003F6D9A5D